MVSKSGEAESKIGKIGWEKQKGILKLLASGKYRITQISRQHDIDERTIHRIRARAIRDFHFIKRELPRDVQDYLRSWAAKHNKEILEKSPREVKRERLEQHKEDLCKAANDVLDKLYEYCAWPHNMTVEEINLERNEPEATGLFSKKVIIGLLAHLQTDIEDLRPFTRWEDLTPNDISNTLLGSISMKAAKREFNGRCDICRDW
jgi:hypothetical protein